MRLGGWAAKTQATEPDSGSQSKSTSASNSSRPLRLRLQPCVHEQPTGKRTREHNRYLFPLWLRKWAHQAC